MSAVLPDFRGYRRIVQSPGFVAMFYDTGQGQGWQRNIPADGSPHLPSQVTQRFGDSRGHWEDDTLVVDVTNFTAKTDFRGSRENLHLVERWTRINATTLEYEVTIEDPTTWTRPWTIRQELTLQNGQANRIYTSLGVTRATTACRGNWSGRASRSRRSPKGEAQIRPPRTPLQISVVQAVGTRSGASPGAGGTIRGVARTGARHLLAARGRRGSS